MDFYDYTIIAAVNAETNVLAENGKIPWHIPSDLRRFKKLTMGHPVIMGRKTYESLEGPLSGRTNIVLTTNKDFRAPSDVIICSDMNDAIEAAKEKAPTDGKIFCIGGGEIYREFLPRATSMVLTYVLKSPSSETKDRINRTIFPSFDLRNWKSKYLGCFYTENNPKDSHTYFVYEHKRIYH